MTTARSDVPSEAAVAVLMAKTFGSTQQVPLHFCWHVALEILYICTLNKFITPSIYSNVPGGNGLRAVVVSTENEEKDRQTGGAMGKGWR